MDHGIILELEHCERCGGEWPADEKRGPCEQGHPLDCCGRTIEYVGIVCGHHTPECKNNLFRKIGEKGGREYARRFWDTFLGGKQTAAPPQ